VRGWGVFVISEFVVYNVPVDLYVGTIVKH